jgi:tRNA threonylcarbamoyladenosine biosynthesis protein TsaB
MILALDTATSTASVAIYDSAEHLLLAEQTWQARRRQTEEVVPVLKAMMARLQLDPATIDTVAVTTGPGSFTGVRIAISIAKGMALGLPVPPQLVGIPTLSVTAAPWLEAARSVAGCQIWAFIQAGRGRYNWAIFQPGDLLQRPTVEDHFVGNAQRLEADLAAQSAPVWLVGEVTTAVAQFAGRMDHVYLVDDVGSLRRAGQLARLAALHLAAGNTEPLDRLEPLYLREP